MTSPTKTQRQLRYLLLGLLFVWAFLINISYGSVEISISNIIESVMGNNLQEPQLDYIIHQYRIPKAITAVIVGAGLSICGLLMQTLFKNP